MTTAYQLLTEFILKHAHDSAIAKRAIFMAEPFLLMIESGRLQLAPAGRTSTSVTVLAIERAFGQKAEKVIQVTCPSPHDRFRVLRGSETFDRGRINADHLETLRRRTNRSNCLQGGVALHDHLRYCLRNGLPTIVHDVIWQTIYGFLDMAVKGEVELIERLTPLILLLPKAIPLGEKADEPGTWLVLTA